MQIFDTDSVNPFFDQTVQLDGTDYVLAFHYVTRESCYYVSIGTPAGVWLVTGCPVFCKIPLFENQRGAPGMPSGALMVYANGPDTSPPALGELGLGNRCTLAYLTAAEMGTVA